MLLPGFLRSVGSGQGSISSWDLHFSEEGQFPWLCASWDCHGWWAPVASCPLQGHLSTLELLLVEWPLPVSSPKPKHLVLSSCPVKQGWQTHLNLTRVQRGTSYSPGSHREPHKQTNLQMWEPSQGGAGPVMLPRARERSSPRKGKSPSWLLNKNLSHHDFGLEVPRSSICLNSSNKTIYISVCTYRHVSKQLRTWLCMNKQQWHMLDWLTPAQACSPALPAYSHWSGSLGLHRHFLLYST